MSNSNTNPNKKDSIPDPPKWVDRLLERVCSDRMLEGILGDLHELYESEAQKLGYKRAQRSYFFNALGFLRPFAWKKSRNEQPNPMIMWFNNFKLAFRYLVKHRSTSFINIFGLTVGIAAYLLLIQHISFEYSYEDFIDKKDRIYRVSLNQYHDNEDGRISYNYYGMAEAMVADIPEVESFVTFHGYRSVLSHGDDKYLENNICYVDSNFFQLFSFPLLNGNPATALSRPDAIVISDAMATKYFGANDPIGQTIRQDNATELTVTGVIQVPNNSHFRFDFLLNNKNFVDRRYRQPNTLWNWSNFQVYVGLEPGALPEQVEGKLPGLIAQYKNPNSGYKTEAFLEALPEIHLHSTVESRATYGRVRIVNALLAIAFFILLIAWINYVNLSTAEATERAKEVSIRKVVGARRSQLIGQFVSQSLLTNGIAFGLALLVLVFGQSIFAHIMGSPGKFHIAENRGMIALFALFFITGVLISGLYPALVISAFQPVVALKGKWMSKHSGSLARKGLSVFQFSASILLIAGTFALHRQIKFMQSRDLGFNPDQTLVIIGPRIRDSTYASKLLALRTEIKKHPSIDLFSVSSSVPGKGITANLGGIRRQGQQQKDGMLMSFIWVDAEFPETFEMEMVAGRTFKPDPEADNQAILLNESAVAEFGFESPEDAIGQFILWGRQNEEANRLYIVGVLKDYHHNSLREAKEAMVFVHSESHRDFFSMKVTTTDLEGTISHVQHHYQTFFQDNSFDYFFLDDAFNAQYGSDQRLSKILGLFGLLAVFIACLGLFGLASFTAIRKTKEIGIRKVLGASLGSIAFLFTKEFIGPIILANVIALPVAWYLITQWLESYAYAAPIGGILFIIPLILILVIALLTISFHTVKSILINPIHHLRYE